MSLEIASSSTNRYEIEEMLFSRTDNRGVILNGNSVFQRVSGYDWSELHKAPHKLVRHPDMPKGVFHLLWETIKTQTPIGAYICNQTKDGEAYWTYSALLPIDDGYLSIRIKPSSGTLEKIIPIYQELAQAEADGELTPEQSSDRLQERIKKLNYINYSEFCAIALIDEMQSRNIAMGLPKDETLSALSETLKSTGELEVSANRVQGVFKDTHQIPYNMRLQAGRIEGSDGPISVISGNHRQMSQGLETIVEQFRKASQESSESICTTSLQIALGQILHQMQSAFRGEDDDIPGKQDMLDLLGKYSVNYDHQSFETLNVTTAGMRRFRKQCRHMRRALSGLELTRIMCKIERYKIDGEHSGLDEIVTRLAYAQKALEESCNEIERVVSTILTLAEELLRNREQIAA
ncbi:MAG: PAS domain-containing protein [Aliishimia sp.]